MNTTNASGPYREYRDFIEHSGLQHRDSQERIAKTIRHGIAEGRPVIAEGGTGNGKTAAYLLPAIEALHDDPEKDPRRGKKLVISTSTVALQNQLVSGQAPGDIAEIPRVLNHMRRKYGKAFKINMSDVAVVVGARQHLCEESEAFPRDDSKMNPAKAVLIEAIGEENYDKLNESVKKARLEKKPILLRELDNRGINTIPPSVREEISCRGTNGCKCFGTSEKTCAFARKMEKAKEARIIVTNHAMLTMNYAISRLGSIIVVDEANRLPDVLTRTANAEVQMSRTRRNADEFLKTTAQMSMMTDIQEKIDRARNFTTKLHAVIGGMEKAVAAECEKKKANTVALFDDSGEIINELNFYDMMASVFPEGSREALEKGRVTYEDLISAIKLAYVRPVENGNGPKKISASRHGEYLDLLRVVERLKRGVDDLYQFGQRVLRDSWLRDHEKWKAKRKGRQVDRLRADNILWFEKGTRSISMFSAPVDHVTVQQRAARMLFNRSGVIPIFISATLSSSAKNPDFANFRKALGIRYWDRLNKPPLEILEKSEHSYNDQSLLLIPNDLPQPGYGKDTPEGQSTETKNYFDAIGNDIARNARIINGNSMVLCSSQWQVEYLADYLESNVDPEEFQILNTVDSTSPEKLLLKMRQGVHPKKILLGRDTLWNGVDLRGEALRGLFILKIPFSPPTHPVERVRKAKWPELHNRSYFSDVSLPAVLDKMRQGSGRLIRSEDVTSEYGVIVFYDPRFSEPLETQKRKKYLSRVLNSFPGGMPVVFSKYNDIPQHVNDFFAEHTGNRPTVKDVLERVNEGIPLDADGATAGFEQQFGIPGVGM